jgi:hypothetical protein
MIRGGHAYAQGYAMHGGPPEHHWVHENRRIVFWGIVFPWSALIVAGLTRGVGLVCLLMYFGLWWRLIKYARLRGMSPADARLYARHMVIGKFAEAMGLITFWKHRLLGRRTKLIEYKTPAAATAAAQPMN